MAMTVADFFVERLRAWGVRRIFGYPGDGINGVLGSLQRRGGDIEFIQVRHEEMAAFMAAAHAKFSGELGVCLSTGGPGATHLVTGLYDARLDHVPVLAIAGQAPRTARGSGYQQELNLDRLFADVAAYVCEVEAPAQVRHVVDRACRIALADNAVTAIVLPHDVQVERYEEPAMSIWTARAWPSSGRNSAQGKVVPTISSVSQPAISSELGRVPSNPMLPVTKGRSSGSAVLPSSALATPAPRSSATSITSSAAPIAPAPTRMATRDPVLSTSAARRRSASRGIRCGRA